MVERGETRMKAGPVARCAAAWRSCRLECVMQPITVALSNSRMSQTETGSFFLLLLLDILKRHPCSMLLLGGSHVGKLQSMLQL